MKSYIFLCLLIGYTNAETRIRGGIPAEKGQFPYVAGIKADGNYTAMGTILNNNWILTTMMSVYRHPADSLTVVVGTNNIDEGGSGYSVAKIVKSINFEPDTHQDDVALLKTTIPIEFNELVQPIPIQTVDFSETHEEVIMAGYGSLSSSQSPSKVLHYLEGNLETHSRCALSYLLYYVDIYDTMICTQGVPGKGGCMYDQGAPLVMDGKLIGILSFGKPCGQGMPDVYQRMPKFASYISSIIG